MRLTALLLLLCATCHADALRLSSRYGRLTYGGYTMERTRSGLILRGAGERLAFRPGGDGPVVAVSMGIRNLIGGDSRQLVGVVWSGGAHCCHYYWIVDIGRTARVVFDSSRDSRVESGAVQALEDIDGDGTMELVFQDPQRGWTAAPFAYWPAPLRIFRFDKARGEYRPANHLFPDRVTRHLRPLLQRLSSQRQAQDEAGAEEERRGDVIEAALTLIYAGRWGDAKALVAQHGLVTWREVERGIRGDPFVPQPAP